MSSPEDQPKKFIAIQEDGIEIEMFEDPYFPRVFEDLRYVEGLRIPERDFVEGIEAIYETALNLKTGVVLANLVHVRYPKTICQIQIIPSDKPKQFNTWFAHTGEREDQIPEETIEGLFIKIIKHHIFYAIERMLFDGDTPH